jgi:hypothetical protein
MCPQKEKGRMSVLEAFRHFDDSGHPVRHGTLVVDVGHHADTPVPQIYVRQSKERMPLSGHILTLEEFEAMYHAVMEAVLTAASPLHDRATGSAADQAATASPSRTRAASTARL